MKPLTRAALLFALALAVLPLVTLLKGQDSSEKVVTCADVPCSASSTAVLRNLTSESSADKLAAEVKLLRAQLAAKESQLAVARKLGDMLLNERNACYQVFAGTALPDPKPEPKPEAKQ